MKMTHKEQFSCFFHTGHCSVLGDKSNSSCSCEVELSSVCGTGKGDVGIDAGTTCTTGPGVCGRLDERECEISSRWGLTGEVGAVLLLGGIVGHGSFFGVSSPPKLPYP